MTVPIVASRSALRASLLAFSAASLIGCAGGPKYKTAKYSDAKLATPPHNLSPADYPFDDEGRYRKDWVANPSSARRSSSTKRAAPGQTMAASAPPPRASSYPTPQPQPRTAPPAYQPPPTIPVSQAPPAPRPAPPAPKPARYHTVAKGDTLYSIARSKNVSVAQLKSTNGLTSDLIRIGQTLRIP